MSSLLITVPKLLGVRPAAASLFEDALGAADTVPVNVVIDGTQSTSITSSAIDELVMRSANNGVQKITVFGFDQRDADVFQRQTATHVVAFQDLDSGVTSSNERVHAARSLRYALRALEDAQRLRELASTIAALATRNTEDARARVDLARERLAVLDGTDVDSGHRDPSSTDVTEQSLEDSPVNISGFGIFAEDVPALLGDKRRPSTVILTTTETTLFGQGVSDALVMGLAEQGVTDIRAVGFPDDVAVELERAADRAELHIEFTSSASDS